MKKRIKERGNARLWVGTIVAALVAAIAVFFVMLEIERKALAKLETCQVLVASDKIRKGQLLTEENLSHFTAIQEIDMSYLPEERIASAEQLTEQRACIDIAKGSVLTPYAFTREQVLLEQMEEPVIVGFRADDLYQVAGGILRVGDRVHIYHVDELGMATLAWQDVTVQQVFDGGGNVLEDIDRTTPAQRLNLYLRESDVAAFYSQLAQGTMRIVKTVQ